MSDKLFRQSGEDLDAAAEALRAHGMLERANTLNDVDARMAALTERYPERATDLRMIEELIEGGLYSGAKVEDVAFLAHQMLDGIPGAN